jgi:hypothetical protein
MQTEESAQNEIHIGFRIPANLREAAQNRMQGKFSTFSEYLRDLIRRDSEKQEGQK